MSTEKPVTSTQLLREWLAQFDLNETYPLPLAKLIADTERHLEETERPKEAYLFAWVEKDGNQFRVSGEALNLVQCLLTGALDNDFMARVLLHASAEWLHRKGLPDISEAIMDRVTLQHLAATPSPQTETDERV